MTTVGRLLKVDKVGLEAAQEAVAETSSKQQDCPETGCCAGVSRSWAIGRTALTWAPAPNAGQCGYCVRKMAVRHVLDDDPVLFGVCKKSHCLVS